MKITKNEKGSLALFVSIAMLFFIAFLMVMYVATANEQKTQLAITTRIKQIYEKDLSDERMEEIYNNLIGTDEYIPIYTAEQLRKVGTGESVYVSEVGKYYKFNLDSNYILKNNIDLNKGIEITGPTENENVQEWDSIGTPTVPFIGIFDGNNYTISGLYIDKQEEDYKGLFGCLDNNGTIKNVVVSGYIKGKSDLGGIVGYNKNGNVTECVNNVKMVGSSLVGGIAGYNKGKIKNCVNETNGIVTVTDNYGAGGIAGRNENKIEGCYNNAEITGLNQVGGIVGNCDSDPNVLVSKCYNTAKIYGTDVVGGIVGGAWQTNNSTTKVTIELCYNKGEVETTASNAGGIAGWNVGIITDCYNVGNIKGISNVGGIAGQLYNTNITTYNNPVGKIMNCYSTGTITGTTANTYGGITGIISQDTCKIINSYYLTESTSVGHNGECNPCEITAKDSAYMKSSDFVNDLGSENFKLLEGKNDDYPVLKWENH